MDQMVDEVDIERLVKDFELCRIGKENFPHQSHLMVAFWYLQTLDADEAGKRMKASLLRFLQHHSVPASKYHETITVFWVQMVANQLAGMPEQLTVPEKLRMVLANLGTKELIFEFYSEERLQLETARTEFVRPDLKNLKDVTKPGRTPTSPAANEVLPETF